MKLLRVPQVVALTGLSRMTIYRMEKRGEFPDRVQLGPNSIAWHEQDVNNWIAARPPAARAVMRARASQAQATAER
jgi:prophage regulatory protein